VKQAVRGEAPYIPFQFAFIAYRYRAVDSPESDNRYLALEQRVPEPHERE
jgi:hypothetical protein